MRYRAYGRNRQDKRVTGSGRPGFEAHHGATICLICMSFPFACNISLTVQLIQSALDLPDTEKKNLVPCLMSLKTWPMYQSIKTGDPLAEEDTPEIPEEVLDPEAEAAAAAAARMEGWKTRRNPKAKEGDLSPNMQGCLLLQAMVKLPGSNEVVLERCVTRPQREVSLNT